ncbi:hypothetical protein DFH05DRAFT_228441 [Lentinula detonsa]|uniref:Uncharacterized protein n=1 Tax=Lentinula detonsa TaxID=2804962 RepID=A0A9W8NX82_9AGAR|nr:hypothetical protein DFH05DRAFT_228441 [Lentinula detonsa]
MHLSTIASFAIIATSVMAAPSSARGDTPVATSTACEHEAGCNYIQLHPTGSVEAALSPPQTTSGRERLSLTDSGNSAAPFLSSLFSRQEIPKPQHWRSNRRRHP